MSATARTGAVAKTLRNGDDIAREQLARINYGGSASRGLLPHRRQHRAQDAGVLNDRDLLHSSPATPWANGDIDLEHLRQSLRP